MKMRRTDCIVMVALLTIVFSCSSPKATTLPTSVSIKPPVFELSKQFGKGKLETRLLLDCYEQYITKEGPMHRGPCFQELALAVAPYQDGISPADVLLWFGLPDYVDPGDKHSYAFFYFCTSLLGIRSAVIVIVEHEKTTTIGFNDPRDVDLSSSIVVHSLNDLPSTIFKLEDK